MCFQNEVHLTEQTRSLGFLVALCYYTKLHKTNYFNFRRLLTVKLDIFEYNNSNDNIVYVFLLSIIFGTSESCSMI